MTKTSMDEVKRWTDWNEQQMKWNDCDCIPGERAKECMNCVRVCLWKNSKWSSGDVCVCCWWPITSYSETSIAAVWWCWPTSSFVIVVVVVIIVVVVVVLNNCSLSWFKDLFRKSNTHTLCFRLLRIDEEEDGGNKNSFLICESLFMMIFKTDFHIPNA